MQKTAQIVCGRRIAAPRRAPASRNGVVGARAALRRDVLRVVSVADRSDVARVFDSVFGPKKYQGPFLSHFGHQIRRYSTENKSDSTSKGEKNEKSERSDAKEEFELPPQETPEPKKTITEELKEMDESTINRIAGRDLPAWQYLVMILTILLILVCIWRAHRYGSVMGDPPLSEFSISALKWFPTREGSRLWGWLTNLEVPISLRKPIYGLYSRIFGVNLDEAEYPMEAYASLARFFTRNLKKGSRWIDPEADMISPVDGKILHFGVMKENGTIEQVKGIDYTLEQLIGKDAVEQLVDMRSKAYSDPQLTSLRNEDLERASFGANGGAPEVKTSWSEIFMNWLPFLDFSRQKINTAPVAYNTYYCVIYLAPGDYHAFHSPVDWKCIKMRHFPGDLFSVSPIAARWIKGLFALNERIVLSGYWRHGFMSYIPVGAYNVGSITLEFDEEINTNQRGDNYAFRERNYGDLGINMGEKIGWFNLGSTIVMVFDAPQFVFRVTRGQKVKLGQVLGNILTPDLKEEIELENEFRVRAAVKKDEKAVQEVKEIVGYEKSVERVKSVIDGERAKIEEVRVAREAKKSASQ